MEPATNKSSKRLQRVGNWIIGLLAALILVFLAIEGPLLYELSMAAFEGYPNGVVQGGSIHPDSLQKLAEYSPQRLSTYLLVSPSARWRAVLSQVLGTREIRENHSDWSGVAPRLFRAMRDEENSVVRHFCINAIDNLSSVSQEELTQVLSTIHTENLKSLPTIDVPRVIDLLLEKHADKKVAIQEFAINLSHSAELDYRKAAFEILARHFSSEPRTKELLFSLLSDPNELRAISGLSTSVRYLAADHPEIIRDLFSMESEPIQMLVMNLIGRRMMKAPPVGSSADLIERERITNEQFLRDDDVIRKTEALAVQWLSTDDRQKTEAARQVLQYTPRGPKLLVLEAINGTVEKRARVLAGLRDMAWRVLQQGGFQFDESEANILMRLLLDPEPRIQAAAADVINPGIPPVETVNQLFPPGVGPRDPKSADVFRKLLDDPEGRFDWLALNYFERVAPFEESDISRIERAIRRDTRNTAQAHNALKALEKRFPNDPRTQALIAERADQNK